METVNKKVLIIALALAALTAVLVYAYVSSVKSVPQEIAYVNVYVASRTIPANSAVTDSDIKIAKVPKDLLNPKAVMDKSQIVGKRLKDSIIQGEEIVADRLADESKVSLSFRMPAGKRALSIEVDEQTAVSGLLRPGDFVDIVASFEKEEAENGSTKTIYPRITSILLQNAEVLALGQDQAIADEKLKELPKTVTLAVDPQDVEKVIYASEYGVLRLVLRSAEDKGTVKTQGAIRQDVVPGKGSYTVSNTSNAN